MCWTTKRELKKEIEILRLDLAAANKMIEVMSNYNEELADKVEEMMDNYPFNIGDVVYDLQLRSATGRFTKTKPSRKYSVINEVVVDKKNYFKLVDRLASNDVFKSYDECEAYLASVCID